MSNLYEEETIQLVDKHGDTFYVERYSSGDVGVDVADTRVLLTPDMVDVVIAALGGTPPERPVEMKHGLNGEGTAPCVFG